ncbi:protein NnrT [Falsihalocynthiibacter sp. SS001]|uniref:protein NnrT n=1 Tax=Falsihalocynthiibacter sp. SS001 TaxID=3349698 RepID=UPI0036D27AFB
MRIFLSFVAIQFILGTVAIADGFERPIPQAQSATAEFWYALACVALVIAMIAVQRLVARR